MQTIQLDQNNNILLNNYGSMTILDGANALAQDIARNLSVCQGENPYNTEEGINYDNNVLGKLLDEDFIKDQLRNRILENEEVLSVGNIDIQYSNQQLAITTDINSIYGSVKI